MAKSQPPSAFLDELVAFGKRAPDQIFATNARHDVYASVFKELGPYRNMKQRRAVMLEVLRVLAGRESTWQWNAGRDSNTPSTKPQGEWEAGAFQVSADGMHWGPDLKPLVARYGKTDAASFQVSMKLHHQLAIEYAARLLRYTTAANGPVARHEINPDLSRSAVEEFGKLL